MHSAHGLANGFGAWAGLGPVGCSMNVVNVEGFAKTRPQMHGTDVSGGIQLHMKPGGVN
jgi:hypothetical protein